MNEIAQQQNIFFQWLFWQFFEVPKKILQVWKNYLLFNLNYFSVPLLFKTFFSYWRRYRWYYPRGFDLAKYLEVFVSNLISRILGAIMRIFLIAIGIFSEIFIFLCGLIIFFTWLLLPLILVGSFFWSLTLLF